MSLCDIHTVEAVYTITPVRKNKLSRNKVSFSVCECECGKSEGGVFVVTLQSVNASLWGLKMRQDKAGTLAN